MTANPPAVPAPVDNGPNEVTIIPPSMELKRRALRPASKRDVAVLIEKADRKVEELKPEFGSWMEAQVGELRDRFAEYLAAGASDEQRDLLYRALHDIRGNAETFGHNLAGRIADNMCKLFDAAARVPSDIVAAHVQAIQAVVRENATTADHPVGGVLMRELQRAASVLTRPEG